MQRRDILKVILKSFIFFTLNNSFAFSQLKKKLKNDEEWKKVLTPEQFYILRREGTERPFSSILNNEYRDGDYVCIACNTKLFIHLKSMTLELDGHHFLITTKVVLKQKLTISLSIQE